MNPSEIGGNKLLRPLGTGNTCRAFSIVEILVVLAIFSMMVGVFVVGFDSLKDGFKRELELKDEIQQAIHRARYLVGKPTADPNRARVGTMGDDGKELQKIQTKVFIWYPADHSYIGITGDDGKELEKIDLKDRIPFQFLDAEANRELASICVDPSGVLTPFRLAYRAENREFQTYKVDIFSGQLVQLK